MFPLGALQECLACDACAVDCGVCVSNALAVGGQETVSDLACVANGGVFPKIRVADGLVSDIKKLTATAVSVQHYTIHLVSLSLNRHSDDPRHVPA